MAVAWTMFEPTPIQKSVSRLYFAWGKRQNKDGEIKIKKKTL
jgi:hypothetical protein